MNAPAKVAAKKADAETPSNTALWDALGKTDPKHTKSFKRAGGFSGTALKPQWAIRRLTEQFGPCGKGWAPDMPTFQVVPGNNGEVLVYCMVSAWYMDGPNKCTVHGVGGDKIVTYIKANQQYNRPERWENDDEAFKKAFTDALMNAFKFVGVGADIHMGQFDDSKYVAAVAREFAEGASNGEPDKAHPGAARGKDFPEGPATGIHQLKQLSRPLYRDLAACGDADQLDIVKSDNKALIAQIEAAWPDGWNGIDGDGNKYPGFKDLLEQKFEMENAA